ncbi:MAG: hypothetical protein P8L83_05615 [Flavobacteriaceae bacterium]|nr:hypothetical protein [Flavobacteriaceae bacterium]
MKPNYAEAYADRGISQELLGNVEAACDDCKTGAKLGYKKSLRLARITMSIRNK